MLHRPTHEFDHLIALSFPGKLQEKAHVLKAELKFALANEANIIKAFNRPEPGNQEDHHVFVENDLSGRKLNEQLSRVFSRRCLLIVFLIEADFWKSEYCQVEWDAVHDNQEILDNRIFYLKTERDAIAFRDKDKRGWEIFRVSQFDDPEDVGRLAANIVSRLKEICSWWQPLKQKLKIFHFCACSSSQKFVEKITGLEWRPSFAREEVLPSHGQISKEEFKDFDGEILIIVGTAAGSRRTLDNNIKTICDRYGSRTRSIDALSFPASPNVALSQRGLPIESRRSGGEEILKWWDAQDAEVVLADLLPRIANRFQPTWNIYFAETWTSEPMRSVRTAISEKCKEDDRDFECDYRWINISRWTENASETSEKKRSSSLIESASAEGVLGNLYLISGEYIARLKQEEVARYRFRQLLPLFVHDRHPRIFQRFFIIDAHKTLRDPEDRKNLKHYWEYARLLGINHSAADLPADLARLACLVAEARKNAQSLEC